MLNRIESFEGSRHFRLQYIADSTVAAVAVPGTGSLANAAIIDLGDSLWWWTHSRRWKQHRI